MPTHLFSSFDDCLGPQSSRYFGDGYTRVRHGLSDLRIDPSAKRVEALGHIEYERIWSRKGGAIQEAHLSSIDAIVLSARLTEELMSALFCVTDEDLSRSWISEISVRAGAQPLTQLDAFEVSSEFTGTLEEPDRSWASCYTCTIGPLVVGLTVQHGCASEIVRQTSPLTVLRRPGHLEIGDRIYGDLHKSGTLQVHSVDVDTDRHVATAKVSFGAVDAARATGLESAYTASITVIDAVLIVAQLAQVILYTIDGLSRDESDTLWMRRIAIAIDRPVRTDGGTVDVSVRARNAKLLDLRAAGTWRVSEFVLDEFCHISGATSVAHRLDTVGANERAVAL